MAVENFPNPNGMHTSLKLYNKFKLPLNTPVYVFDISIAMNEVVGRRFFKLASDLSVRSNWFEIDR